LLGLYHKWLFLQIILLAAPVPEWRLYSLHLQH
jgi:hypothetical protein